MTNRNDPLLTLDEAGELLGTGPGLPRRLVALGQLDHVQDGGELRIPQSALLAYLTIPPDTDTDTDATTGTVTHVPADRSATATNDTAA